MSDELATTEPFAGLVEDTVAAAVLGLVAGGGLGAVAALTPLTSRLLSLSRAEMAAMRSRSSAMWVVAAEESEHSVEELVDLAERDDDRRHLAYTAAEAAARSRFPERILALGRLLGAGLIAEDQAKVDDQQQVIDALSSIERPHLKMMAWLARREGNGSLVVTSSHAVNWDDLCGWAGQTYRASLSRLIATLEREGILDLETVAVVAGDDGRPRDRPHSGHYWRLSEFGLYTLAQLESETSRLESGQT